LAGSGSILIGLSGDRRFKRVLRFLHELDQAVGERTDAQGVYVRSEDFEDPLSEMRPRVARERNEEKRRMYRDFLADASAVRAL
jgi:hypothetical protein